jgi:SAM-dependent methyltransferase
VVDRPAGRVARAAASGRPGISGVVWDTLGALLADRLTSAGQSALDILDVGGGTGGFAVPLAGLGHRVTVVDPSPDALASLERRAGEAAVTVRALQGDAAELLELVGPGSADLVLCHGVLEHVEDLRPALDALVGVLRPAGALSVLAANRNAVVLARAIAGHFGQARHALDDPTGRWGPGDPLPRRFTETQLVALLADVGLSVLALHGVRGFADLVPGALVDHEPGAVAALHDLEAATADHADFRAVAAQLHVLAVRP